MALKFNTGLKNYIVETGIVKRMAGTFGTGGTASIKIYNGDQPADADSATAGTLLCTIISMGWRSATSGSSAFQNTAGYAGTAAADGSAGWARMETLGTFGTMRIDGEVGTASTCTFVIDAVTVSSGGAVTILSCPIYMA